MAERRREWQGRGDAAVVAPDEVWMAEQEPIELEGTVTAVLPNATFRVALPGGHDVLASLGGKLRQHRIRILAGDAVRLAVSPYDLTRGRITFRYSASRVQPSGGQSLASLFPPAHAPPNDRHRAGSRAAGPTRGYLVAAPPAARP